MSSHVNSLQVVGPLALLLVLHAARVGASPLALLTPGSAAVAVNANFTTPDSGDGQAPVQLGAGVWQLHGETAPFPAWTHTAASAALEALQPGSLSLSNLILVGFAPRLEAPGFLATQAITLGQDTSLALQDVQIALDDCTSQLRALQDALCGQVVWERWSGVEVRAESLRVAALTSPLLTMTRVNFTCTPIAPSTAPPLRTCGGAMVRTTVEVSEQLAALQAAHDNVTLGVPPGPELLLTPPGGHLNITRHVRLVGTAAAQGYSWLDIGGGTSDIYIGDLPDATLEVMHCGMKNLGMGPDSAFLLSALIGYYWDFHFPRDAGRVSLILVDVLVIVPDDFYSWLSVWWTRYLSPIPSISQSAAWLLAADSARNLTVQDVVIVPSVDVDSFFNARRTAPGQLWYNVTLTAAHVYNISLMPDVAHTGVMDVAANGPGDGYLQPSQVNTSCTGRQLLAALSTAGPATPFMITACNLTLPSGPTSNANTVASSGPVTSTLQPGAVVKLQAHPLRRGLSIDLAGRLGAIIVTPGTTLSVTNLTLYNSGVASTVAAVNDACNANVQEGGLGLPHAALRRFSSALWAICGHDLESDVTLSRIVLVVPPEELATLTCAIQGDCMYQLADDEAAALQSWALASRVAVVNSTTLVASLWAGWRWYGRDVTVTCEASVGAFVTHVQLAADGSSLWQATHQVAKARGVPVAAWAAPLAAACLAATLAAGVFLWRRHAMAHRPHSDDGEKGQLDSESPPVKSSESANGAPGVLGTGVMNTEPSKPQRPGHLSPVPPHVMGSSGGFAELETCSATTTPSGAAQAGSREGAPALHHCVLDVLHSPRCGNGAPDDQGSAEGAQQQGATPRHNNSGSGNAALRGLVPTRTIMLGSMSNSMSASSGASAAWSGSWSGMSDSFDRPGSEYGDYAMVANADMREMLNGIRTECADMSRLVIYDVLGAGAHGVVYRGEWRGRAVAVKTLLFQQHMMKGRMAAMREVAVNSRFCHPNIVNTLTFELKQIDQAPMEDGNLKSMTIEHGTAGDFKLYIVQEFCDAGHLKHTVDSGALMGPDGAPDMLSVVSLALDIACGLQHIHFKNVIHGDLSPANVLLKSDPSRPGRMKAVAKVGDFSLSKCLVDGEQSRVSACQGTPHYTAPEVLLHGNLSRAADIFSFGLILHELYCGQPAWRRKLRVGKGRRGAAATAGLAQLTCAVPPPPASPTQTPTPAIPTGTDDAAGPGLHEEPPAKSSLLQLTAPQLNITASQLHLSGATSLAGGTADGASAPASGQHAGMSSYHSFGRMDSSGCPAEAAQVATAQHQLLAIAQWMTAPVGACPLSQPSGCPDWYWQLIASCLQAEPADRPKLPGVVAVLLEQLRLLGGPDVAGAVALAGARTEGAAATSAGVPPA